MADTNLCPCGSNLDLNLCCLPLIQGKKSAPTAEALLRARYTAFTRGDIDFVFDSHHSRTRHEIKRDEVEEWSKGSEWQGLQILQLEAGQKIDSTGTIIFAAHYKERTSGKVHEHCEKSFFEKENGEWKFLDAQGVQTGTYRRAEPKIGRNDPCSCGSGKKYKKCHGLAVAG